VYPYLQHCVTALGSTYPTNLNRIILLQKRIVRILDKQPFDAHTDPLFIKLKIHKFDWIYLYHFGKFMYQYHNGLLPRSFDNFFLPMNQVHIVISHDRLICINYCSVGLILENFLSLIKVLSFFNSLSDDIRSAPIVLLHSFLN
jgi:hypothetical protein